MRRYCLIIVIVKNRVANSKFVTYPSNKNILCSYNNKCSWNIYNRDKFKPFDFELLQFMGEVQVRLSFTILFKNLSLWPLD